MLDNVTEITYEQLIERFKFLVDKYGHFKIHLNADNHYNPKPVLIKNCFDFPNEENNVLCYTTPRPYERCSTNDLELELNILKRLLEVDGQYLEQKVTIVDGASRFSVCGVYVDEANEFATLLNGYYDGKPVNWSHFKDNIY